MLRPVLCLFLFYLIVFRVYSQKVDTLTFSDVNNGILDTNEVQHPLKAALYSSILPGLGQVYNKSYWKAPLVFSGFLLLGHYIDLNNYRYLYFRNALLAHIDEDPNTIPPINLSMETSSRNADLYRRYRDLSIILTTAFYFLNIAEAYVDAHLQDFDVSDNVSKIKPVIDFSFDNSLGLSLLVKVK
jgi:hypothetical protein